MLVKSHIANPIEISNLIIHQHMDWKALACCSIAIPVRCHKMGHKIPLATVL